MADLTTPWGAAITNSTLGATFNLSISNIDKAITNNSFKVLLPEGFSSWSKDVITGSIGNRIGSQGSTSFAVDWGKSSFGTNFGGNFIGNIVGSLLNASIK